MKKLILLLLLFSLSFSADKWEYIVGVHKHDVDLSNDFKIKSDSGLLDETILTAKYGTTENEKNPSPVIKSLNKLGDDGWELVQVRTINENKTYFYLKRKMGIE